MMQKDNVWLTDKIDTQTTIEMDTLTDKQTDRQTQTTMEMDILTDRTQTTMEVKIWTDGQKDTNF